MTYYFCDLEIDKTVSFHDTAMLLGDIFGVPFIKDETFRFDEVLAYIADSDSLEYILFCVPEEEAMFYDDISYYHLRIRSQDRNSEGDRINISSEIKRKIDNHGRLRCEIMKNPED